MMDQLTFFSAGPSFPASYEDLDALYREYIFEGEKDDDAFTWSEIKNGRSYSMYGKKIMEFYPDAGKGARLRILPLDKSEKPLILRSGASSSTLRSALEELRRMKRQIFRGTITEVFGCCNDFMKCSDQKQCIHQDDRFYNGCAYRANLEAGRIFYGSNRIIETEGK